MQSYWPSNFENDSTSPGFEPRPTGSSGAGAGWQTFSWDLQLWKLVTLRPFDRKTSKFQPIKDLNRLKKYFKYQEASSILKVGFTLSKYPYFNRAYVVCSGFGCLSLYVVTVYNQNFIVDEFVWMFPCNELLLLMSFETNFPERAWYKS